MKNIPIVCTLASLSSASLLVLQVDARQLVPMNFFSIFFFIIQMLPFVNLCNLMGNQRVLEARQLEQLFRESTGVRG